MNVLVSMPQVEALRYINPAKKVALQVELDRVFTKLSQLKAQVFLIAEQSFARDIFESTGAALTSLLTKDDREFLPYIPEFQEYISDIPINSEMVNHSISTTEISKVKDQLIKTMGENYKYLCEQFDLVIEFTMPKKFCVVEMGKNHFCGLTFVYRILSGDEFFYIGKEEQVPKIFYEWRCE